MVKPEETLLFPHKPKIKFHQGYSEADFEKDCVIFEQLAEKLKLSKESKEIVHISIIPVLNSSKTDFQKAKEIQKILMGYAYADKFKR